MLEFLQQFGGTVIVLLIVLALVALAIRSLVKDRKNGKGLCGGNCGSCSVGCAHGCGGKGMSDEEIKKTIEKYKQEHSK
ncbi:MAG: FeoB-associated Cys-rich membrane protein [Eubacteriales bacterium]